MIVDIFCTSTRPWGIGLEERFVLRAPAPMGTGTVVGAGAGVVVLGVAGELVGMSFQGW